MAEDTLMIQIVIHSVLTHPHRHKVTAVVRSAQLIGDRGARGFAVLRADGGVNCWGHPSFGGDCDLT